MTARERHLWNSYGITEKEYNAMLKKQKGGCALCGAFPKTNSLHVDHNHVVGFKKLPVEKKKKHVRGILCFKCNKFRVGRLNLEWADKIADYLRKYDGINTRKTKVS
jgi:hypothetical protein